MNLSLSLSLFECVPFITDRTNVNTGTRGIAITPEDQLIVVEANKHCITIINTSNGEQMSLWRAWLRTSAAHMPMRGSFDTRWPYYCCQLEQSLPTGVYSRGCFHIFCIGSEGSQPLQFLKPICCSCLSE